MKLKKNMMGMTAILAVIAAIWGTNVIRKDANQDMITTSETTEALMQKELPVSEMEAILLSKLYRMMQETNYSEAARLMNENEKLLTDLLAKTLDGAKYCYWETDVEDGVAIRSLEPLEAEESMEGMVLTRYNTVFYGTFEHGKPESECCVIQTMVLDAPRYTFAEGMWKNGKMNGEGRTGYHYYLSVPSGGLVQIEKIGTYVDNLLDGEFQYRTQSSKGEILTWEMEAERGVTVLDDRWKYFQFRKEYMLGAKEDSVRAYVLSEEKVGATIWNNVIIWDE